MAKLIEKRQLENLQIKDSDIAVGANIATSKLIDGSKLIKSDGTVPFLANQSLGGFKLTNIAAPTVSTDAIRLQELTTLRAEKGQPNGYPSLDGGGKIPATQLPNSVMELQGNWNAATNTPTLIDGAGNPGDVYQVTTAGTQNLGSGSISYAVGDFVIYGSSGVWFKSLNSNAVVSVFGRTGTITAISGDYSSFYPLLNGTGATGNWPIDVSGNASTSTLASNSTLWNGLPNSAGNISTPTYVVSINSAGSNAGNTTISQLGTTLGLNNGSTLANSISGNAATSSLASNSTLWNNQTFINTEATATPFYLIGYDLATTAYKPTKAPQVQAFLGLGSAAYLNGSVAPVASTAAARDSNGYLEANFFKSVVSATNVQGTTPSSIYGNAIGNDGYHYSYSATAIRAFLSIPSGGDTLASVMARGNETPYSMVFNDSVSVLRFAQGSGVNYIQSGLNLTSGSVAPLVFSGINGVIEYARFLANGNFGIGISPSEKLDVNGKIIVRDNLTIQGTSVNSNTTKLFINNTSGKQWAMSAGVNSSNENDLALYNWTDSSATPYVILRAASANLETVGAMIASTYIQGSRGIFGYDPGVSGGIGASNWFRSSGATGWVNDTYGGGIYQDDTTWIRTHGNKGFHVKSGQLYVDSTIYGFGIVSTGSYFKTTGVVSMAGDYDSAGPADKVIWTIGDSWASVDDFYGLGYEYEKRSTFAHTVNFAEAGEVHARISLSTGSAWLGGSVTADAGFYGNLSGNATTASNSTLWAGNGYNGAGFSTTPSYILAHDGTNWRPGTSAAVQLFVGLNNGSTLTNSISGNAGTATQAANSTTWNGYSLDTGAVYDSGFDYILGRTTSLGQARLITAVGMQAFVGLSNYELLSNKSTSTSLGSSNTLYPTQNAVKTYVDNNVGSSGRYTPVITDLVNTTGAPTSLVYGYYIRVGNMVTVTATIPINSVSNNFTSFSFSLPVASNFTDQYDGRGTAVPDTQVGAQAGYVFAETTNKVGRVTYRALASGFAAMLVTFTYAIL